MLGATDVLGATYTPHCAAIHPARLVRGLAQAVERRGVTIHEGTKVTAIEPGVVRTERGDVRAPRIVRATEAWTSQLPGYERDIAPVYSLMLATEPLPAEVWDEIGLRRGETFSDQRHLIIYGQRTADDRFAFGGRGAPYHFGSRIKPEYDRDPGVYDELWRVLRDLFPAVGAVRRHPHVGRPARHPARLVPVGRPRPRDRDRLGRRLRRRRRRLEQPRRPHPRRPACAARRTRAPRCRGSTAARSGWEPEPLRWLGVNLGLRVMGSADGVEERTGRSAKRAEILAPLIGGH